MRAFGQPVSPSLAPPPPAPRPRRPQLRPFLAVMCDLVGANASTPWFHDGHHDHDTAHHSSSPTPPSVSLSDHSGSKSSYPISHTTSSYHHHHHHHPPPPPLTLPSPFDPPSTGIPSPEQAPEQAPPRYSLELASTPTPRHGTRTHLPSGQQLPPMEPQPSSPVTLPSFNSLDSFLRRCSSPTAAATAHDPLLITRHAQNGPLSSGPHLKLWKSENMVIDQPSATAALAGQQLNIPAPSLPTGYPGYATPNTSLLPSFSSTIQDASPSRRYPAQVARGDSDQATHHLGIQRRARHAVSLYSCASVCLGEKVQDATEECPK